MRAPGKPLRILIADDHPLMRHGLRQDLEQGGLEVVAEVSTGSDAIAAALRERPDLCLLDIQMPGNGIVAARAIRSALPSVKIILITATPDQDGVRAAVRAGADGYLPKDVDPRRLPHVVRVVVAGETTYPRRLLGPLLQSLHAAD
jgi:two-component system nitrate/nitrite response regulator NarL